MSIIDGLTLSQKDLFKDQDIEQVKLMVRQLLDSHAQDTQALQAREHESQGKIAQMDQALRQLSARLADTERNHQATISQLQQQRQMRKQDQINNQVKIKQMIHEKASPIYFSPKTEQDRSRGKLRQEQQQSPEKAGKGSNIRRYETPIYDLLENRHTEPTKDQIHRLNSYLIENTTTLKLLVEKHNYLIKLRGMGERNGNEEAELMAKSKRSMADRTSADQARQILQGSRKKFLVSDNSESDIENEQNHFRIHNK